MRDGWVETELGHVAEVVMGQSPPGETYNLDGRGLPFIQGSAEFGARHPTPVRWCSEPRKVAQSGDLLVSVRAPVGDLNFAEGQLAIGRGLAIVRAHKDQAVTAYLALALELAAPAMRRRSGGTMFESISGKELRLQGLILPPLAEQGRIVDLIGAVDATTKATTEAATRASRLRSALLFGLLTGEHEIPPSYDRILDPGS